jgi:uncharacterized protein CbrC (UPF0167 family)
MEKDHKEIDILDEPCVFCGYNGPGYWQEKTHKKECPWFYSDGAYSRKYLLRRVVRRLYDMTTKENDG